ncbi:MAG TPA: orotidine-5'-phosphate decarboxylase [Bacillota bacterium]|nr:orotidine-5'-phosphate decarboxylase [Bacillota bacterium]HOL08696.1 orotidine-5'-phosphate decarboxylase [Bacillota bacterium]HPO96401.1 orotidine-5'-phosphate decarboxylase [Bacillota bacterium]
MKNYQQLINQRWQKGHFLCVGLDTDYNKIPTGVKETSVAKSIFKFNKSIIDATAEFCCAFKPNIAFYEGHGLEGIEALINTNNYINECYPEIPIILDAKRADIGSTNLGYLKAVKEVFKAQAITVHPYLGGEALKPFLDERDLGVIVLCHTSNPGAKEFQEIKVDGEEVYKVVAKTINESWNYNHNCSLVVGATYPEQLREVRAIAPELPLLIPGIGAQGGDLELTVRNGLDSQGKGIIINASRSIIYASSDADYADAARNEAAKLAQAIQAIIVTTKQ